MVQDNGGGTVQDSAPKVPAPTEDTLGAGNERDRFEFQCDTTDNGGGVVQDSTPARRLVVVPMRKDDDRAYFVNQVDAMLGQLDRQRLGV